MWSTTIQIEYAADVIGAAFNQLIQIVVAQEFINELQRTTRSDLSDPALEFALQFPTLPQPDATVLQHLQNELGSLIFPTRSESATLRPQDQSISCTCNCNSSPCHGFVTSDEALLRVAIPSTRNTVPPAPRKEFAALVKSAEVSVPLLAPNCLATRCGSGIHSTLIATQSTISWSICGP